MLRSLLCLVTILLLLPVTALADDLFRVTSACASMAADSSSGLTYGSTVKAAAVNRVLRAPVTIPDGECVSSIEIAGATTAPGGPIFASLYVLRSGSQATELVGRTSIPEGKSGVYKASFPLTCLHQGDAPYIVVALNAGGGIPYETASCSYIAISE